ncbi:nucleotidyltransferase family protein [Streptomyces sp. UNOB3_S3]|uniref:nucleotidyltransferase family protein n=1 Tax=Streptomyces sp. UNOB3_S3 TaxID=2871682 RepID=UPI001E4947D5|nr:nucleotidyltransferase domain-containing protein [Streptomyces sp. UNOB3_S3]MCC3777444.1 nucleotidyltransferase domain-containing protein [Streptomyces sp. UNOB3_S3]
MKRERATRLLHDMIDRLEKGGWPLNLVEEIYLFGSYARGALEPSDVDLVVQHTDPKWLSHSLDASINGRDSYIPMKQALRGRTRGLSFQFQERDHLREDEGFELILLWQRGDSFSLARQRIAEITADPQAKTAPRDHMLDAFTGLAQVPPRPVRIELHELHTAGRITITRIDLPDAVPTDEQARRHIRRRWIETSPLRRAGAAAVACLEQHGTNPSRIELHSQHLHHRDHAVDCFVDLGWRYFFALKRYLDDHQSWLEVPTPHPTKPMEALLIRPIKP